LETVASRWQDVITVSIDCCNNLSNAESLIKGAFAESLHGTSSFFEATKSTNWLQDQSAGLSNEHPDSTTGSSTALINLDVSPVIGNAKTLPCTDMASE